MKRTNTTAPTADFQIIYVQNGIATIEFYENVTQTQRENEEGEMETMYEYDCYTLERKYYLNLALDIGNNLSPWLDAARNEDIIKSNDIVQNRADIDYLLALNS